MKDFSDYIEQMINSHLNKVQVDVDLKDGIYYISTNYVLINARYVKRRDIVKELIIEALKQCLPEGFINYKIIINR